jgi:hypothetical protein
MLNGTHKLWVQPSSLVLFLFAWGTHLRWFTAPRSVDRPTKAVEPQLLRTVRDVRSLSLRYVEGM